MQVVDPLPIEMPTDEQTKALIEIVHRAYPRLQPSSSVMSDAYFHGFEAALARIAYLKRTPTPDRRHYLSWHIDECRQWLNVRCAGWHGDVSSALLTAIVAAGDIVFTPGNPA